MFEILQKLLKAKYVLTLPKKNDLMIFDRNSHILKKPSKKNFTLDTRYETINLLILFKTFLD